MDDSVRILGDFLLVAFLDEVFRIDVSVFRVEVVRIAIAVPHREHLADRAGFRRRTDAAEVRARLVIERLGKTTVNRRLRERKRHRRVLLPCKEVAIALHCIAK